MNIVTRIKCSRSSSVCAVAGPILAMGFVATVGLSWQNAYAVPAAPVELVVTQPNGDTVTIHQTGDENDHQVEDSQGYTIGYSQKGKRWNYLTRDADGNLQDSNVPVRGVPRNAGKNFKQPDTTPEGLPEGHSKHLRPAKVEKRIQHDEDSPVSGPQGVVGTTLSSLTGTSTAAVASPSATVNVPVILVNFNNTTTTNTPADFNTLLFGTNPGNYSMKQFYQEASYGRLTVSPGTNGIKPWVAANNTHDYYGANNPSLGNMDSHPGVLVYKAVQLADAAGFDFSQYDADGDCYVDEVVIVHQGTGEESSAVSTDIWSHTWDLYSARYYDPAVPNYAYSTNDYCKAKPTLRVKVQKYTIQPERFGNGISTVGVFVHEFGHILGLPDLYDTDNSSFGVGKWSVMAYGCWNGISKLGDRPAHFDAWSKFFLGWTSPYVVSGSLPSLTLNPAYGFGDVLQIPRAGSTSEYYLIENRAQGGFDAALPAAGLAVWHVDTAVTDNTKECYPGGPSCATQHYKVALVQADNLWNLEKRQNQGDSADLFPGSYGITGMGSGTALSGNWYDGTLSNASVGNVVVNSDSTVTADYAAP